MTRSSALPRFTGIVAAAALIATGARAPAAAATAQATAVIRQGIAARAPADPASPQRDLAAAARAQPGSVVRPCRPGDPEPQPRCRLFLLEME